MRSVKQFCVTTYWICSRRTGYFRYKIICLCYVGPILKVISCLDYANVLLCNYARIQVMILENDWGSYQNLIHAWTYIIVILISYPDFNWIILSCTCIYLPCIITINVLTVIFFNNSIITAPTCALITTSWYTKMVQMYNIKVTEHLLYTRILCLLLSLYST